MVGKTILNTREEFENEKMEVTFDTWGTPLENMLRRPVN